MPTSENNALSCLREVPKCRTNLFTSFNRLYTMPVVGASCSCNKKKQAIFPVVKKKFQCMSKCLKTVNVIPKFGCAKNIYGFSRLRFAKCCSNSCAGKMRPLKLKIKISNRIISLNDNDNSSIRKTSNIRNADTDMYGTFNMYDDDEGSFSGYSSTRKSRKWRRRRRRRRVMRRRMRKRRKQKAKKKTMLGCGYKIVRKKPVPKNFSSSRSPAINSRTLRRQLNTIFSNKTDPAFFNVKATVKVEPVVNVTDFLGGIGGMISTLDSIEEEIGKLEGASIAELDHNLTGYSLNNVFFKELNGHGTGKLGLIINKESIRAQIGCLANQCGSRVTIVSSTILRKITLATALQKLKRSIRFGDIFQSVSERILLKRVNGKKYLVFVPFNNAYIQEF